MSVIRSPLFSIPGQNALFSVRRTCTRSHTDSGTPGGQSTESEALCAALIHHCKVTSMWQQLGIAPAGDASLACSSLLAAGGVATLRPCREPRKSVGTMLRSASDVPDRLLVGTRTILARTLLATTLHASPLLGRSFTSSPLPSGFPFLLFAAPVNGFSSGVPVWNPLVGRWFPALFPQL